MIWLCMPSGGVNGLPDEKMADMIRFAVAWDRSLCVYMGIEHLIDPDREQLRRQNDEACRPQHLA